MNCYSIAGIKMAYEPKYPTLRDRSKAYLTDLDPSRADFTYVPDYDYIDFRVANNSAMTAEDGEYSLVSSAFSSCVLRFGGTVFHSSCVVLDGQAYCFSADSGVGKSTHTSLWLKAFADNHPFILNDDKPALMLRDGKVFACGTPFSGKYDMSRNLSVPLKAICFVQRAKENSVERISSIRALPLFLAQTPRPDDEKLTELLLGVTEQILEKVPLYILSCNMDIEAAHVAYNGINEDV